MFIRTSRHRKREEELIFKEKITHNFKYLKKEARLKV